MLVCINFSKINNVTFNSKYVTVIDNVSKEYIEDSFKKTLYAYLEFSIKKTNLSLKRCLKGIKTQKYHYLNETLILKRLRRL